MNPVILFLVPGCGCTAQVSLQALLEQKLQAQIRSIDESLSGVLGVAAIDLNEGQIIQYNGETSFPQASSIKIPILMQVYRAARSGKLSSGLSRVTLNEEDVVEGSGHLKILLRTRPLSLTVRELASAMIETSDNTATNQLIGMVGMDAVNRSCLAQFGLKETKLQRRMLDSNAAAENRENISTPLEMAQFGGDAVPRESRRCRGVQGDDRDFETGGRELSATRSQLSVPVASKPGELNGVRAETGIVFLENRPLS